MREENQLRIILKIIENYKLDEPLARFLKKYFKAHRNMGSNDRALTSSFIYNYFRVGGALRHAHAIEKLFIGNFLCSSESNPLLSHCLANFSDLKEDNLHLPLKEKFRITKEIAPEFKSNEIFPFDSLLSEKVDGIKFAQRFLHRPRLWIRIRKKFLDEVKAELAEKAIPYLQDTESPLSLSFSSSKSLTNLKSFEFGYFEIQDWASQQTLKYIPFKENDYWWDACAGSGGKSLMLADAEPSVQVLATDTRDSILENFGERFRKTGFTNYKSAVLDLTKDISVHDIPTENLSGIIADVPCSGSGTWSHTPERLLMFSENELERYRELQRKIIQNLVQFLKPGMPLVYITCSVFKKENEDNLDYFTSTFPLEVIKSGYIDGVSHDADTLFAAQMVAK